MKCAKIKCTRRKIVHHLKFISYHIKTNVGENGNDSGRRLFLICTSGISRSGGKYFFPYSKLTRSGSRTRYESHLLKEIRAKLNFSSRRPSFNDDNRKDEDRCEYYICIFIIFERAPCLRAKYFSIHFFYPVAKTVKISCQKLK